MAEVVGVKKLTEEEWEAGRSFIKKLAAEKKEKERGKFDQMLREGALGGHLEVVRVALNNRASIDYQDSDGYTALMRAAEKGHNQVVKFLLSNGADKEVTENHFKKTALLCAAHNNKPRTVRLLLNSGAKIDAKNYQDSTALMLAASNGYKKVAELLLKNGADIIATSSGGGTALDFARTRCDNRSNYKKPLPKEESLNDRAIVRMLEKNQGGRGGGI